MRVLGLSGSLREGSHNTQLLRLVAEELPADVDLHVFTGLGLIPPYDEQRDERPPFDVRRLKHELAEADVVLFATPEYNGSVPGQLKNALDWVSRPLARSPLRGKPVAVIGASTGQFGGVWAQAELRKVLGVMGAQVLPVELGVAKAHERLVAPDDELREAVAAIGDELVATGDRSLVAVGGAV